MCLILEKLGFLGALLDYFWRGKGYVFDLWILGIQARPCLVVDLFGVCLFAAVYGASS